jgi:hypothetical protein
MILTDLVPADLGACTAVSGARGFRRSRRFRPTHLWSKEDEAPIGWAAAEFRHFPLLSDRPADARQAIEPTPLLNLRYFRWPFRVFVSFLITLASPRAERACARPAEWSGSTMHRATDVEPYRKPKCLSITMVLIREAAATRAARVSIRRLLRLRKGVPIAGRRRRHTKACAAHPGCRQCCQGPAATPPAPLANCEPLSAVRTCSERCSSARPA